MSYDSLITMKRSRQRMQRELTKWSRQKRQWATREAIELSINRGFVLLAELIAICYEIAEREAGLEMEGEANGPDV